MKMKNLMLAVAMMAGAGSAYAQHSVNASATNGLMDLGVGDASAFSLGAVVSYRYALSDTLQIAVPVGLGFAEDYNLISLGVGPIFNFGGDLQNSMFASVVGQWTRTSVAGTSDSVFVIEGAVGKRFQIAQNVSYEPAVIVNYGLGDAFAGDRMDVGIRFLSLTASF